LTDTREESTNEFHTCKHNERHTDRQTWVDESTTQEALTDSLSNGE